MKILLCSIGSRGDIQPFMVLGDHLSNHGHEVRVASANIYEEMAKDYNIEYHSFEGDYGSIVDDEEIKKMVGKNPMTMRKNLAEKVYPILQNSIQKFYELSTWADVIIYHPKTLIDCFGHDIQNKLIKAYVIPAFSPTKEFKNPIIEFFPLPKFLNKWSYKFVNSLMNTVKTPIKNFRKQNKLPETPLFLETAVIYGISPLVLDQPKDYPPDHNYTGFWLKETRNQSLDDKIVEFCSDDKKVLIITFGSMPYKSSIDINDFISAILSKHDIKIFIVKAWGLKDANINESQNVMAIDRAPFDLLFPLADYIIHHGGAGTTATALRAGLPQFICPILHPFGDQYFWGKTLERKKLGVRPIPLKKLKIKQLTNSVDKLLAPSLSQNAKTMCDQLKSENGLEAARSFIEKMKS